MMLLSRTAVAIVALLLACVPASAGLVAPGGSFSTDAADFVEPTGELLASDARTVTINFDTAPYEPAGDQYTFDVAFTSEVRRDPVTQHLTFVYRFDRDPADRTFAREGGFFSVGSFDGFTTDVSALGTWTGTRSADGSTILADSVGQGLGTLPYFVIATDATAFDSNGSLSGGVSDEFSVTDPLEPELGVFATGLSATFAVSGTFQPTFPDNGGNNGGGNVIPLPAGVWLGLVALGGAGLTAKARRRLRLV